MKLPFRRKRSRLQRIQDAVAQYIPDFDDDDDDGDEVALESLHWMTAALYVAAGAETALGERRGDYRTDAVRWAPLLAAPIAGAAHVARALWPNRNTRSAADIANGLAIAVGVIGVASSVYNAYAEPTLPDETWSERLPSLAPLAFAAVGVFGMLLDREEEEAEEMRAQLERRARVVERLVPKRKPKLDRIVIHA